MFSKNYRYLLLHIILFNTLYLCGQNELAIDSTTSNNDTCFVSFEEFQTDCLCVLPNSYIILDSDSLLKQWIWQNSDNPNCEEYYPDSIDMNKEVIVGIGIRSGGCSSPKVETSIYRVCSLKKLEVKINVIRRGGCALMIYRIVWIKFEKPPDSFNINVFDNRNKLIQRKSCYE